ncbi:restriction endonuclease subunit S domain-containing protein [Pseudomonas quasicaspiana]|uniref:restriction endonuclease subunit S n=1 Tax=Pseudomonas quasicaspiana TaxID=2829821 RepID=UPI001E4301C3|nr:restriction endonuclease subunit S [Pseudomonas quasicaspiana]MCD5971562.1 restriction endonuclease subunit S [Pseudomonas quasicaspiana]
MTFPAYPGYKDSEITWIGDVPISWEVKPFKWLLSNNDGGVWGDDPTGEGDTFVLRSTDQTVDGNWKLTDPAPRKLSAKEKASALLVEGDLVVTKSSGSSLHIGKTTLVTADIAKQGCCYGNFMQRLRVNSGFTPKLAWYVMNNELARAQLDLLSNSTTGLANLNGTLIGEILLPVSSVAEQTQIARFLDHETARIDALIEEQQRLIELLKEKRQAVISHAVTKGLDPTAPMKDSGVEWLGEVPAHWTVKKIKHYGRVVGGFAFKSTDFCDEGHLVLKISNVGHLGFEWDDLSYLPEDFAREHSGFIAPKGSLIFAMTRPVISGGIKVSRLEEDLGPLVNQRVGFVSINDEILSRYLLVSSQSESFLSQFKNNLTITNQPNISSEGIESIQFAIPPREELRIILDYLEGLNSSFKCLVEDAQCGIELLQERRSALISAAVTGKIDVRGWQPTASVRSHELEEEAV